MPNVDIDVKEVNYLENYEIILEEVVNKAIRRERLASLTKVVFVNNWNERSKRKEITVNKLIIIV